MSLDASSAAPVRTSTAGVIAARRPGCFRAALAGYLDWGSRIAQAESASAHRKACPQTNPCHRPTPFPEPGAAVSFDAHVKPLFRPGDRNSLTFAFDLWSRADVQAHTADILDRPGSGTMPCDGAWPEGKVDVFKRWIESGFQP